MQVIDVTLETRLSIAGMSCAGCVSAVEDALSQVPGVTSAMVNLGERTAIVTGTKDADALIQAIRNAGYDAAELRGLEDEQARDEQALIEYRRQWWRAISAWSSVWRSCLRSSLVSSPSAHYIFRVPKAY